MKKIKITALFIFSCMTLFSHDKKENIENILDTNKIKIKNEIVKSINTIDSLKTKIDNTKGVIIPVEKKKDSTIILVREKSENTDYTKYLLPIFTLLLGIIINKILDRYANKIKIKRAGERWVVELRSTEEPIKKQIESLKEFLALLDKDDLTPQAIGIYSAINGDVFKSLDKSDLIKYIEQKNKKSWYKLRIFRNEKVKNEEYSKIVKISNNTHGHISVLVHQFEMIKERWESYRQGTSSYTTALTKDLQLFNQELAKYSVKLEKEGIPISHERIKPLHDLYMKFIKPNLRDGKYNPLVLENEFFVPVVEVCSKLRLDDNIIPVVSAATACLNDIAGIKMEKTYMIENIKTLITRYEDQLLELSPLVNKIDGTVKL